MEALRKKLKSRRGASILLALLFLLMCIMVGTSLVMAADSNVGKTLSNKNEQQKYLTLSSAMNLLIDEIESLEYVGQYSYEREEKWVLHVEVYYDGEGHVEWVDKWYEPGTFTNTYTQLENDPGGPDTPDPTAASPKIKLPWDLTVLPLYKNMDQIFSKNFPAAEGSDLGVAPGERVPGEKYTYTPVAEAAYDPNTLEFKVDGLDAGTYGGLLDPVEIIVTLDLTDGHIDLAAALLNKDGTKETGYKMQARLKLIKADGTDAKLDEVLVLDGGLAVKEDLSLKCEGGDDTKRVGDEPGLSVHSVSETETRTYTYTYSGTAANAPTGETWANCKTETVKWKLQYVTKGGQVSDNPKGGDAGEEESF